MMKLASAFIIVGCRLQKPVTPARCTACSTRLIPLLCMIRLDGFGFSRFGMHGLLWTDAGANLLVFGVVVVIFIACSLKLRRVADSHATARASSI